jgi:bacillithiol biosynthesis deacetylase BshB1
VSLDVLAIGPHPDDVELGCGGTLAKLAAAGRRVGILHLTSGEAGTRGTAELRQQEAKAAATALGASELGFLDCSDGGLRTGAAEEDCLIERLRAWRPKLVLAPPPVDRHPDHGRGHDLVMAACFYAGLARRSPELGAPHRPDRVFSYMLHDDFMPSFIVDVSSAWEQKMAALDAYASQLFTRQKEPKPASADEPTKVASADFRRAIEGRARHFGLAISAERGEPFLSRTPLAVGDPCDLIPAGLR